MSARRPRNDFTENLEAVARGVRRLEQIQDPVLREAVAAALRLRLREHRLDPASRVRMRNSVLAALAPTKPTLADRVYGAFALIGMPAPIAVRALAVALVIAGALGGATVASADSLPSDALYPLKLAGEQLRLAIAISPEDRAAVELSIAEHRLSEAERLATSGRADDAIIATASYGSSLADAAADLASVEARRLDGAALVGQLQSSLTASRQHVAATAAKLAADPRTAATAEILASVAATAEPTTDSPATKIADQAAAITARLVTVADARAELADQRPAETPAIVTPATARPSGSARPRATAAATARPRTTAAAARTARPPSADVRAARHAAERAKEAARRALDAAERAKREASRTDENDDSGH
ncbi:MAG: DUF5667 domain-containing protein [Candidatus Limnocylindria bacterium]